MVRRVKKRAAPTRTILDAILDIPAEDHETEFKRIGSTGDVSKVVEAFVSMTNAEGGLVIVGIEGPEDSSLKGHDRVFGIEENLDNYDAISREIQKITPPITNIWPPADIFRSPNGRRAAVFLVPKAVDGLRSINGHVYVREEKSNRRLTPAEVIKFSYAKGFERADRELVEVGFGLLNTELYKTWRKVRRVPGKHISDVLERVGLARRADNGSLFPTRAAVLLFAEYPSNLMDTKSCVRVLQYVGKTVDTRQLVGTPQTLEGPIIEMIEDTHEYVLTLLRSGVRVPSGFVTRYQIPDRAVKEAITNAIIHRDYHIKRDVEIRIFEDRIEIESPGLLPFNITPSNIGRVRADGWRNDLLVKHLREFPSPPNLDQNEGVPAMRTEMRESNLYPPVFRSYPELQDSVRVVLSNEKVASEWEKVSSYLRKTKYITNEEAREITGVVQRDRMSRLLSNWVGQGLLKKFIPKGGYVKGTKYRLPETKVNK